VFSSVGMAWEDAVVGAAVLAGANGPRSGAATAG